MDAHAFIGLKRKVEALGYSEPLDNSSALLVQKLVEDVVHATDSFRTLQQKCAYQQQEIAAFDSKASADARQSRLNVPKTHTTAAARLGPPCPSLTCRWCLLCTQMEAVRQDSTRLQSENSQLHVLVLQHTERHERQAREHYQECKRLQDAIAELSYWKHQAAEKMQAAERESSGLRKRCDELVKLTDRLTTGTSGHVPLSARWDQGA